jgi:beta-phosphoglucomutase-like phosphatase (HAD superfamily)
VNPALCAVVEDTVIGVRAGVSAGATVFGYAPLGEGQALLDAGACAVFRDMAELPGLMR